MQVHAYYDRDIRSIHGAFTINVNGEPKFKRIPARSGQVGWTDSSWIRGKSPLPFGVFTLHTQWEPAEPNASGPSGLRRFYLIENNKGRRIYNINKQLYRENAGVHEENDKPGTACCVAIVRAKDFADWCEYCEELVGLGVKSIPITCL